MSAPPSLLPAEVSADPASAARPPRDDRRDDRQGALPRGRVRAARRVSRALRTRLGQVALVIGPAAVIAGFAASMNRSVARERATGERVAHTHEVRSTIATLLARLSDAE